MSRFAAAPVFTGFIPSSYAPTHAPTHYAPANVFAPAPPDGPRGPVHTRMRMDAYSLRDPAAPSHGAPGPYVDPHAPAPAPAPAPRGQPALDKTPTEADIDVLWAAVRRQLDAPRDDPGPHRGPSIHPHPHPHAFAQTGSADGSSDGGQGRGDHGPRVSRTRGRADMALARARLHTTAAPAADRANRDAARELEAQEAALMASLARLDSRITAVADRIHAPPPAPIPAPAPAPRKPVIRRPSTAQRRQQEQRAELLARDVDDPAAAAAAMMVANRSKGRR